MKLSHVTKTIVATDARSNGVVTEKQRWCLTVTQRLTAYRRTIRFVQRNVNFLLRRTVHVHVYTHNYVTNITEGSKSMFMGN